MTAPRVRLRPAKASDCELTYAWASDPQTRLGSFNTAKIGAEEHKQWFGQSLDGDRQLLIAEVDGRPVGLLRFDPIEDDPAAAEIGITVAPNERGRGMAGEILDAGLDTSRAIGLKKLTARIRLDNPTSMRVFERAGYIAQCDETVRGVHTRVYARRISSD